MPCTGHFRASTANDMLKKLLKRVAIVIIAGFVLVVIFLAHLINMMVNRPQLIQPRELDDRNFKEFFATNENGHRLFACFYKGETENGVVLLCHGHGVNHGHMDDMTAFLRQAGLGIILFDFRAHGKSEGQLCTIGLKEKNDAKAVLTAARAQGFINERTKITAYGRSMGAATLINGSADLPEISAFILESSFEKLRKIAARDAWHHIKLPDTPLSDLAFWLIDKITATEYSKNNPVENIKGIGTRPALLIHDELDHRADESAFNALQNALPTAKTFVAKGAGHVQAHKIHGEEFERLILDFMQESGTMHNEPKSD